MALKRSSKASQSESNTPAGIIHEGSPIEIPPSVLMCVLYSVLSHVIVASCCTFWTFVFYRHGGFIRGAEMVLWTPVSRLSFGMYLVHPILINLYWSLRLAIFEPLTVRLHLWP